MKLSEAVNRVIDLARKVREHYAKVDISFVPDLKRQSIVDTWPMDTNDDAARREWGFAPHFGFDQAFTEYLVPAMRKRYSG